MSELRAGVHTVDITPHDFPGIRLGGFGFNRRATGVLHPLEAAALYLTCGDDEIALVTVDSVGLGRPWVERIRDAVTEYADPSRVLVCATHSHAAPDTMGYWGKSLLGLLPMGSGIEPGYMEQLVAAVAEAADEAKRKAQPARLAAANFEPPEGLFRNDREKGLHVFGGCVLRVDQASSSRPLATILNFAAHPEGLWDRNRQLSPDYPHHARVALREAGLGAPLFFSGALGGMLTPEIPRKTRTPEREAAIERIGQALGEAAATAARDARPVESPTLSVTQRPLYVPLTNWRFRMAQRLGVFARSMTNGAVRSEMTLVRVGPLSVLTVPGEALPELGVELRAAVATPGAPPNGDEAVTLLLGLGCDELGYLLPETQWDDPHWKYEAAMAVSRAAGPMIAQSAAELARTNVDSGTGSTPE